VVVVVVDYCYPHHHVYYLMNYDDWMIVTFYDDSVPLHPVPWTCVVHGIVDVDLHRPGEEVVAAVVVVDNVLDYFHHSRHYFEVPLAVVASIVDDCS